MSFNITPFHIVKHLLSAKKRLFLPLKINQVSLLQSGAAYYASVILLRRYVEGQLLTLPSFIKLIWDSLKIGLLLINEANLTFSRPSHQHEL